MEQNPPTKREMRGQSLGWEDPLEKGTSTHSSILAWRIPWEEPGGLQFMGLQRVRHDLGTKQQQRVYGKMQESGLAAVIPLTCISALWGRSLGFSLSPQVRLWGWLQQLTARRQASCLHPKFPRGSPLGQL